ncbi:hypothetical protein B0H67DRAFT_538306 [Lasiosphaeris hirsuta]|uniref:RNA-binding protein n=1 Tax=Lasiosphaeris hirsuta TaxID=260670 RepID=A0AA40DWJ4_9PEZI|nr:hypothetical protein B0H67DRAFT_538306 [Lasiosphaeris hirsuta]
MLFTDEEAPHLKKWIVKRIENTSDADADVLADYVLALLRHDGDISAVRRLCETEIPDFLKEDPSAFVNDVFETVAYKSYLPGAPPPPSKQITMPFQPPLPPGTLPYDDVPMSQGTLLAPQNKGLRKRLFNDRGEIVDAQNGKDAGWGGRAFKQPRRGGRGGRADDSDGPRGATGFTVPGGQSPSQFLPTPTAIGHFDANAAMEALFSMPMTMGVNGMPNFSAQVPRGRRRHRCRDYDTKGYCARGNTCMFEHGDNSMYMPPPSGAFGAQPGQAGTVEEYDPANALMAGPFGSHGFMPAQQSFSPEGGYQGRPRGGKQQNLQQKRRAKAPYSADGPIHDRTKSTIVVENIPEENFKEDQVRGFFTQFGHILEVSMQPYKRLAIVKFDGWGPANAAYKSPKVIFDNRFVKVFWYKEEVATLPPSMPLNGGGLSKGGTVNGQSSGGAESPAATAIDMDEFLRKQEEAQKAKDEKTQKREALERQRLEVERQQQELDVKRREEKAKLIAKLAQKTNGAHKGENGDESMQSKPMTQTEALKAQVAALEEEARQLGLDPDVSSENSWNPRGGFGQGRGAPARARGYGPRGAFRGAPRGRGNHHAAYAAYSLDNRPKRVVITGVDFTVPEKDETLRQYLFGIGEFTDIQTNPAATQITFKDRKTAEKFFHGLQLNNKEIPGVEGQVEPSWSSGGPGSSAGSTPTPTPGTPAATPSFGGASASKGYLPSYKSQQQQQQQYHQPDHADNDKGGGGGGSVSGDKDVQITLDRPTDQIDYDVGDEENEWEY